MILIIFIFILIIFIFILIIILWFLFLNASFNSSECFRLFIVEIVKVNSFFFSSRSFFYDSYFYSDSIINSRFLPQIIEAFIADQLSADVTVLHQKIAAKFLIARKWDLERAIELFKNYQVFPKNQTFYVSSFDFDCLTIDKWMRNYF